MRKLIKVTTMLLAGITLSLTSMVALAFTNGTYTTIDDATGKPRAVVSVYESNGTLYAKVLSVYKQPGDTGICDKCPGNFKGKPIVGLVIMWGLKETTPNEWSGGKILDAKSGSVYSAKVSVMDGGAKLKVRGFIGVSLLGRTQYWNRN